MTTPNLPKTEQPQGDTPQETTRRTPLYQAHLRLGGRMVDFGGWRVPIQYSGIIKEHKQVREGCGLFDVSHMGEIFFEGPHALATLQKLTTNDLSRTGPGQALYTVCCNRAGGIIDDLVIYNLGENRYMACVNAANKDKDLDWFLANRDQSLPCTITDRSHEFGLIALQGPLARAILGPLVTNGQITPRDPAPFRFTRGTVAGVKDTIISRTGYTGEDGFELYVPADSVEQVWEALLEGGAPRGLLPCGFGARDSLRMEMKYCLYGNDIDETTSPLEAGLGWLVKFSKGDFIGKSALEKQKLDGVRRRLVGLEVEGRSAARQGSKLLAEGQEVGRVTSGTFSPSLGRPIGIAYVDASFAAPGTSLTVELRGRPVPVKVVKTPFYKRSY